MHVGVLGADSLDKLGDGFLAGVPVVLVFGTGVDLECFRVLLPELTFSFGSRYSEFRGL
jgi:hypothetical protein